MARAGDPGNMTAWIKPQAFQMFVSFGLLSRCLYICGRGAIARNQFHHCFHVNEFHIIYICMHISYHIISYHIISYHAISCRFMSTYVISNQIISYNHTSKHIKSYEPLDGLYHIYIVIYIHIYIYTYMFSFVIFTVCAPSINTVSSIFAVLNWKWQMWTHCQLKSMILDGMCFMLWLNVTMTSPTFAEIYVGQGRLN